MLIRMIVEVYFILKNGEFLELTMSHDFEKSSKAGQ